MAAIRKLDRAQLVGKNNNLGKLHDLKFIPEHKLAYTLSEFMALQNTNYANSECIGGNYAKYMIGKKKRIFRSDKVIILISAPYSGHELQATFELKKDDELVVFHHGALISTNKDSKIGKYIVKGIIPPYFLNAGNYSFSLIFGENQRVTLLYLPEVFQFEIMNESIGSNSSNLPGVLRPDINYKIDFKD